ncbi:hypothetical protein J437_LFUL003195 [Ladona fulva]|uniref:Uncharacterized protein n=1 Tax=Ladona fulva TaxID=123851 RepID=A0A8K0JYU7_LADFU|nr:hypothetical protein J437_LFUL003195 [Ladona fulva]
MCLMITYLYYFLSEKLQLSELEWSRLRIVQDIDKTKVSWYLGYVANITNSLPTSTAFYGEISIEDLLTEGLIFTSILTISSVTVAFALRNSNVLVLRPLQLPQ